MFSKKHPLTFFLYFIFSCLCRECSDFHKIFRECFGGIKYSEGGKVKYLFATHDIMLFFSEHGVMRDALEQKLVWVLALGEGCLFFSRTPEVAQQPENMMVVINYNNLALLYVVVILSFYNCSTKWCKAKFWECKEYISCHQILHTCLSHPAEALFTYRYTLLYVLLQKILLTIKVIA